MFLEWKFICNEFYWTANEFEDDFGIDDLLNKLNVVFQTHVHAFSTTTLTGLVFCMMRFIHPASRGVAAHTAGLFRSVRGAKGGFPPWGLPKLRILTFPPWGLPKLGNFHFSPPWGLPKLGNFHFSPPWGLPKLGNFHFSPPWGLPQLGNFHFSPRGGSPS